MWKELPHEVCRRSDTLRIQRPFLTRKSPTLQAPSQARARVAKVQRTLIPGLQDSIRRTASERPGASRRNSAASAAALSAAETAFRKKRYKDAVAKYKEALKLDVLSYPAALGLAKTPMGFTAVINGMPLLNRVYDIVGEAA